MALQGIAESWFALVARALTDGTLVFVAALALWLGLRRWAPARLGHVLFVVVLLKVALPVELPAPTWLARAWPEQLWGDTVEQWTRPADESPIRSVTLAHAVPRFGVERTGDRAAESTRSAGSVADDNIDWRGMLFLAWAVVAGALLLRFSCVQIRTHRTVRRARPIRPDEVPLDLDELRRLARVRRPVRWLVAEGIDTPAAGGLLAPYVLMPNGLLPQIAARPLSWVLLHELAHVRRHDIWVALLQRLVQIAFFFHPAVWLANRLIDEQREFACDDDALAASGAPRKECGQGFLSIVEWACAHEQRAAATLGMFDSNSVIRRRLMRILNDRRAQGRFGTTASAAVVLAFTVLALPTAAAEKAGPRPDVVVQDPQDPQKHELDRLRKQLARLEAAQAKLQQELERLERGEDKAEETEEAEESERTDEVRTETTERAKKSGKRKASIYTIDPQGRPTEVKADSISIYTIGEGDERIELRADDGYAYVVGKDGKVLGPGIRDGKTYAAYVVGKDGRVIRRKGDEESYAYVVGGDGKPIQPITTIAVGKDGQPIKFEFDGGKTGLVYSATTDGTARVWKANAEGNVEIADKGVVYVTPAKSGVGYTVIRGDDTTERETIEVVPGEPSVVEVGPSDKPRRYEVRGLRPGKTQTIYVAPSGNAMRIEIDESGVIRVEPAGEKKEKQSKKRRLM